MKSKAHLMLDFMKVSHFYSDGFRKDPEHGRLPRLWNKQFRIETRKGDFIKLNRFRPRLNFKVFIRLCRRYAPNHLYMSVLNWLMPARVGEKTRANWAYPIVGGYVIYVDSYMFWRPHSHYEDEKGLCGG